MFDKFNFYDFLGYLLPGATVVLTVYWIGTWAFGIPFPELPKDLVTSFLFLGISYVAGHLVQGLGSFYEDGLKLRVGRRRLRLSEQLLLTEGKHRLTPPKGFSDDLIDRIRISARAVFNASDETEIFEEAYALIVQKSLAQHTEVFLALNGLARGMLAATLVGLVLMELVAWKQVLLLELVAGGTTVSSDGLWRIDSMDLFYSLAATVALIPVMLLFQREFKRFRSYFAKSVYFDFLAWFGSQKLEKKS